MGTHRGAIAAEKGGDPAPTILPKLWSTHVCNPAPQGPSAETDTDDGLVEVDSPGGTLEGRSRTEGEHPAVPGDQPVAVAGGRRDHPHDRLVEVDGPGRAEER